MSNNIVFFVDEYFGVVSTRSTATRYSIWKNIEYLVAVLQYFGVIVQYFGVIVEYFGIQLMINFNVEQAHKKKKKPEHRKSLFCFSLNILALSQHAAQRQDII